MNTTPEKTPQEQNPQAGGSYVRQPDGSIAPSTPQPTEQAIPAAPAQE